MPSVVVGSRDSCSHSIEHGRSGSEEQNGKQFEHDNLDGCGYVGGLTRVSLSVSIPRESGKICLESPSPSSPKSVSASADESDCTGSTSVSTMSGGSASSSERTTVEREKDGRMQDVSLSSSSRSNSSSADGRRTSSRENSRNDNYSSMERRNMIKPVVCSGDVGQEKLPSKLRRAASLTLNKMRRKRSSIEPSSEAEHNASLENKSTLPEKPFEKLYPSTVGTETPDLQHRGANRTDDAHMQTDEEDVLTQQARKKLYVTRTSIMQHSFLLEERSDSNDCDFCHKVNEIRLSSEQQQCQKPKHGLTRFNSIGNGNGEGQETQAIECLLSHMSFHSDPSSSSNDEEDASTIRLSRNGGYQKDMFSFDDDFRSPTPSPLAMMYKKHRSLSAPSSTVPDSFSNLSVRSQTETSYSHPMEAVRGKVVHVADILTTERNFAEFLQAYEELGRRYYTRDQTRDQALSSKPLPSPTNPVSGMGSRTATSISIVKRVADCPHCAVHPYRDLPPVTPDQWPQRPLLMRATPGGGTRILGIRYAASLEYLPSPWPATLRASWNLASDDCDATTGYTCSQCQILPINGGTEPVGKSLVVDFESDLFIGTILVRVKDSIGTSPPSTVSDEPQNNYFADKERRYQAVVRGMFKRPLRTAECCTGQAFARPCGNLPSRWILRSAVQIVSIFAPQLRANLDGSRNSSSSEEQKDPKFRGLASDGPSFLSPLASTPQVVVASPISKIDGYGQRFEATCDQHGKGWIPRQDVSESMERYYIDEPADPRESLVAQYHRQSGQSPPGGYMGRSAKRTSSAIRAKTRKKLFDKLYAKSDKTSTFDTDTVYTFEFLQHLVNFETYQLDVGAAGGGGAALIGSRSLRLVEMLAGQPLKCMGAYQEADSGSFRPLRCLWSFDIWHEGLYKDALENDRELLGSINTGR